MVLRLTEHLLYIKKNWYFSTTTELGPAFEIFDNINFESKVIDYPFSHESHGKPFNVFFYNKGIYFSVSDYVEDKTKLYYLDLDKESISLVTNDNNNVVDNVYNRTSSYINYKNKVYFSGLLADGGFELFSLFSNSPPEGTVDVTGSAIEGGELTALANVTDTDGLGGFSYQWFINQEKIPDAMTNTYLVTSDDINQTLTVEVSYYDGEGGFEQVVSEPNTPSVDTDGDGVGDNVDTDDDNDGVLDTADAYPLDASRSQVEVNKKSSSGGTIYVQFLFLLIIVRLMRMKLVISRSTCK